MLTKLRKLVYFLSLVISLWGLYTLLQGLTAAIVWTPPPFYVAISYFALFTTLLTLSGGLFIYSMYQSMKREKHTR